MAVYEVTTLLHQILKNQATILTALSHKEEDGSDLLKSMYNRMKETTFAICVEDEQ